MKAISLSILLPLLPFELLGPLTAQTQPPAAPSTTSPNNGTDTGTKAASSNDATASSQDPAAKLSKEDQERLQKIVSEVMTDYAKEDFTSALTKLDEADALCPKHPLLLNLRGGIYLRQQKWDGAAAMFNNALAVAPKLFQARFNLAEIPFQQKKYADSRALFQKILDEQPTNELVEYKIFLSYLLENNLDQAQAMMAKFDPYNNTPAYYFAEAAWLYNKKQDREANSYIQSATRIYSGEINSIFADPLISQGWLKKRTPDQPTP